MAEILQQLSRRVIDLPLTVSDKHQKKWIFSDHLNQKNHRFFDLLAIERPLLAAQYRVRCAQLISLFKEKPQDARTILRVAETTLAIAELLEHIYRRLEETDDINKLQEDKARLRSILAARYPQFQSTVMPPTHAMGPSNHIRWWVNTTTQSRLLSVRIRRTILALMAFDAIAVCRPWINTVEYVTNPFFLYLSWLFFIPRLSVNLFFLGKHVLPHPWMSNQEYALPWTTRLQTYWHMHRHAFELTNDLGWFLCGILSCFVCTGAWLPARVYLAITMQIAEFIITCLRSSTEINRLNILEQEYHAGCADGSITADPSYLQALKNRIEHEQRAYSIEIKKHVMLNLSILTILPAALALSPFIPLLGAALAVSTSILVMTWEASNAKQRPRDNLIPKDHIHPEQVQTFLTQHSLFKPQPQTAPTLLLQPNLTPSPTAL